MEIYANGEVIELGLEIVRCLSKCGVDIFVFFLDLVGFGVCEYEEDGVCSGKERNY